MGDYKLTFYEGAQYGLEPKYNSGSLSPFVGYKLPTGAFGVTTDPRTANQIKAVSDKISTGAKAVEVTGIDTNVLEYIPDTHFKELARLKELTGVELTFHGPLVEPTGVTKGRWDEQQRVQAERQMWSALKRSHDLNPKGNTVVTFHSSNGLPEPVTTEKDASGKEKITSISVIDERTGQFGQLPKTGVDYWGGDKEYDPQKDLDRLNQENWTQRISNLNIEANRAYEAIELPFRRSGLDEEDPTSDKKEFKQAVIKAYSLAVEKPAEYEKFLQGFDPDKQRFLNQVVNGLSYGKGFVEDAYIGLQNAFNQAYEVAKRRDDKTSLNDLNKFREEIAPYTQEYRKDPTKLAEFSEHVSKGIRLLNGVKAPEMLRPIQEFAVDKASETFGNLAFNAYKEFAYNKDKNTAPIISIENPPVGMGMSRAEDLKKVVEASQGKFIELATSQLGLSKDEAAKEAKKLIGVTWDVGHINMLRKYGYDNKDILAETQKIKPFVKHIHLSDNFGLEHTELPMGMGNVPIKEHEEILRKQFGDKFKEIKQIVETGGWYQHFKTTPLAETFEAFGSPIYPMKASWNSARGAGAGYFTGYGRVLPDINFSTYGASFSSLPPELGGQLTGRNRLSGTPTE